MLRGDLIALEQTITYTFQIIDNLSPTLNDVSKAQDETAKSSENLKKSKDSENISFLTQVEAVRSVSMGFRQLTHSLDILGIGNDKFIQAMTQMGAGITLVSSSFSMLKGAAQILNMVKSAELGLAAVETYRKVLHNPAAMALVVGGVGAAGMAMGYFAGQGTNQTNVNQTFNFAPPSSGGRSFARESAALWGG